MSVFAGVAWFLISVVSAAFLAGFVARVVWECLSIGWGAL